MCQDHPQQFNKLSTVRSLEWFLHERDDTICKETHLQSENNTCLLWSLSSPMAADYAVHWHSLQLIVISYSGLWCSPDLKILFVKRPYLWSVESLAGLEADKPSNSYLPLKRARGGEWLLVFKAPLASFIRMWAVARLRIWLTTHCEVFIHELEAGFCWLR